MLKNEDKSWREKLRNWAGIALLLAWGIFWAGWFAWELLKILLKQGL